MEDIFYVITIMSLIITHTTLHYHIVTDACYHDFILIVHVFPSSCQLWIQTKDNIAKCPIWRR